MFMKPQLRASRLKALTLAMIALLVFAPAPHSNAYLLTEDIPNLTHAIVSQVQNIAQYTATVANTLHTYTTTVQQLQQFYNYLSMFGNPSQVAGMLGLSQEYNLLNGLRNAQTVQQVIGSLNGAYRIFIYSKRRFCATGHRKSIWAGDSTHGAGL